MFAVNVRLRRNLEQLGDIFFQSTYLQLERITMQKYYFSLTDPWTSMEYQILRNAFPNNALGRLEFRK